MQNRTVSVIGLGKLGLCLAASFAKRGVEVIGVDVLPEVVDALNQGRSMLCEPGLAELLAEFGGKRLRATLSHPEAIEQTDVSCVMVHTPSNDDGQFSNQYVLRAMEALGTSLRKSSKNYHLFIINSTVMPGSMENEVVPLLENATGRRLNEGFGLCYCPEMVALGSVIRDFLRPDMVVIGSSDERAGQGAEAVFRKLCENNPPMFQMALIDAEVFKISLNCYITMKISFANALANLCEKIPTADVDVITKALGADRRISPHYLKGGLSYGGTCFPRDTKAFIALAKTLGVDSGLIQAVEAVNRLQDQHLLELVFDEASRGSEKAVSILGLAFKPNTDVIVGSPAIKLIGELLERQVKITAYDPLAMANTRTVFGERIVYADSVEECLAQSPVCVIMNPDAAFQGIEARHLSNQPTTVIDCWRMLHRERLGASARYIPWGVGPTRQSGASEEGRAFEKVVAHP